MIVLSLSLSVCVLMHVFFYFLFIFATVKPYFVDAEKMIKNVDHQRPVGSALRLRCNADGSPMPAVRWFKQGVEIANFDDENGHRKHSTLKLRDLKESDSGNYMCVAENVHGRINFTYSVEVIGKHPHGVNFFAKTNIISFMQGSKHTLKFLSTYDCCCM